MLTLGILTLVGLVNLVILTSQILTQIQVQKCHQSTISADFICIETLTSKCEKGRWGPCCMI